MSGKSESGHAKNVANFETLISFVVGFGEKYKPQKQIAALANLQAMLIEANAVMANTSKAETLYYRTVNQRADAFKPLPRLSTRVLAAFSEVATDADLEDAQAFHRKIQDRRARPKAGLKEPAGEQPGGDAKVEDTINYISVSQKSFDSVVSHFGKLIDRLKANADYQPNEPALKVDALSLLLGELADANTNAKKAASPFKHALIERNALLYTPKTGLKAAATSAKKHVMSVFGYQSAEHRLVSGLVFRKPPR